MKISMGFVGAVLFVASPALATTSISGDVSAGVRSVLGSVTATDSHTVNATAPSSVTISTAAKATASDAGATNSTFANVSATWASVNAGDLTMSWGWDVAAGGYGSSTIAETNLSYPINWQYTFLASGNGVFSGTYSVVGTGDKFGLQPLYTTNDFTAGTLGGTVFDPTGSGTFSIALIAGHTYKMSLAEFGNLSNSVGFVAKGSADALVDWKITYAGGGVPEPASWALMITGFGLMGATLRRRRSPAARAMA